MPSGNSIERSRHLLSSVMLPYPSDQKKWVDLHPTLAPQLCTQNQKERRASILPRSERGKPHDTTSSYAPKPEPTSRRHLSCDDKKTHPPCLRKTDVLTYQFSERMLFNCISKETYGHTHFISGKNLIRVYRIFSKDGPV